MGASTRTSDWRRARERGRVSQTRCQGTAWAGRRARASGGAVRWRGRGPGGRGAAVGGRVPGERLLPAGYELLDGEVGELVRADVARGFGELDERVVILVVAREEGRPRLPERRDRPRLGWDFFEETCRCIFDWKERAARRVGNPLRWRVPFASRQSAIQRLPFFFMGTPGGHRLAPAALGAGDTSGGKRRGG